jgi:nitric oxide reductase subunit B
MGATYYVVPEESRGEIYSVKLAYLQLITWTLMGVTAIIDYMFGWTAGNKMLEQPFPLKIVIVVVMLLFLYNILMTIKRAGRWTVTEACWSRALVWLRCCTCLRSSSTKTIQSASSTDGGQYICGWKASGK